jgi:hypothetical protein
MLLAALSLVVVAAACGGTTATEPSPSTSVGTVGPPNPSGAASSAPQEIPEVLRFEAPTLDGGTLRGESLAGRDVAFWFWAPW